MATYLIKYKNASGVETTRYTAKSVKFSASFMQVATLTVKVESATPIDFAIGDYIDYTYDGLRYTLRDTPTPKKVARYDTQTDGGVTTRIPIYNKAFTYELIFKSALWELEHCLFEDVVLADNYHHFTSLPDVTTYEDVYGIANRIQANCNTAGLEWSINVDDSGLLTTDDLYEKLHETQDFSLSNGTCLDAASQIYSQWGVSFVHTYDTNNQKNVLTFGTPNRKSQLTTTFKYGKGNGLKSIKKTSQNADEIATRIKAFGNTTNLAARHYNNRTYTVDGVAYPLIGDNMYVPNLMIPPSLWGTTVWYKWINGDNVVFTEKASPSTLEYTYSQPNIGAKANIISAVGSGTITAGSVTYTSSGSVTFPDVRKCYMDASQSILNKYGIRPKTIYFDGSDDREDIYPSIKGITIKQVRDAIGSGGTYYPSTSVYTDETARVDEIKSATAIGDNGDGSGTNYIESQTATETSQTITKSMTLMSMPYASTAKVTQTSRFTGFYNSTIQNNGKLEFDSLIQLFVITKSESSASYTAEFSYEVVNNGEIIGVYSADYLTRLATDVAMTEGPSGLRIKVGSLSVNLLVKVVGTQGTTIGYTLTTFANSLTYKLKSDISSDVFEVTLKQLGFKPYTSGASISMLDGHCGGWEFEIESAIYNSSTDDWTLRCNRKKDSAEIVTYPNSSFPIRANDHFVLLNIEMPDIYVDAKAQYLYDCLEKEELWTERFVVEPEMDDKLMLSSSQVLKVGMWFDIDDSDLGDELILIDAISIDDSGSDIPKFSVTLRNEKQDNAIVSLQKQNTQIAQNAKQEETNSNRESVVTKSSVISGGESLWGEDSDNLNHIEPLNGINASVPNDLIIGDFKLEQEIIYDDDEEETGRRLKISRLTSGEDADVYTTGGLSAYGQSASESSGVNHLYQLEDVLHSGTNILRADGTTKQDGDALVYNSSQAKWVAGAASAYEVLSEGITANSGRISSLEGWFNEPSLAELLVDTLNITEGINLCGADLQTTLNNKAALSHTHAISDVTNLQSSLDSKVTANTAITGGTKCKITYDTKGLVTAGADLSESDVPNLSASKITSGTFADARIASASVWNAKENASDAAAAYTSLSEGVTTNSARLSAVESWFNEPSLDDLLLDTLNVQQGINLCGRDLQGLLDLKANDSEVVHLAGAETVSGVKTFSNGFKIGNVTFTMDSSGNVKVDGNLYTTGGLSAYGSGSGGGGGSTTLGGLTNVDSSADTLYSVAKVLVKEASATHWTLKNLSDLGTVKGATMNGSAVTIDASGNLLLGTVITSLSGYATESWVEAKNYITGITSSDVITALGFTPFNAANFTKANIKSTLEISDWALASTKPSYTTSEVSEGSNLYFTDVRALNALSGHTSDSTIHITSNERTAWNAKYDKPSGGIPKTDLSSTVQASLTLADAAYTPAQIDDLHSVLSEGIAVNSNRLSAIEEWFTNPSLSEMSVNALNVDGAINLNGSDIKEIYSLTIQKNGTTIDTYNPISANKTINISDVASAATLAAFKTLFDSMFEKESDGDGGYRIKAKLNFYSAYGISAYGAGSGGGSTGNYTYWLDDPEDATHARLRAVLTGGGTATKDGDVSLVGHKHTKSDISDFPTNVSSFTNDAGYLTEHQTLPKYNGTRMTSSTDIPEVKTSTWDAKQNAISNLSTIISNAENGNTAYGYFTNGKLPYSSLSGTPSSLKNPYALTFGSKTYDGSTAQTITASDLGALTAHQTVTLASGSTNGTLKLTTAAGTVDNIAVTGLGSLAYMSSLTASDIPSLPASKITSGTFADARIASASVWNAKESASDAASAYQVLSEGVVANSGRLAALESWFREPSLNELNVRNLNIENEINTVNITALGKTILTGNVGIGTSIPSYKLDICSTGGVAARVYTSASSGVESGFFIENPNYDIRLIIGTGGINRGLYDTTNQSWMIYRDSTTNVLIPQGNVGIGITSPSYKLDVSGTIRATGAALLGSTLTVTGATTLNGGLTVSGNGYVSGNLGIGITSPSYKLDVNGTLRATDAVTLGSSLTMNGALSGATTGAFSQGVNMATSSGNVGIGTTSPSAKLHVNGANSFFVFENDATLKMYAETSPVYSSYGKESFVLQTCFDGQDGQSSAYPSSYGSRCLLLLQPRGGYVGIGTTAPAQKLDVVGKLRLRYNSSTYVDIEVDSAGNLKINGNVYATGGVTAYY